jgi:hypothetical protein
VADWRWEHDPDDLLDDLPPEAAREVERLAQEIAARDSMVISTALRTTVPGLVFAPRAAAVL